MELDVGVRSRYERVCAVLKTFDIQNLGETLFHCVKVADNCVAPTHLHQSDGV